MSAVQELAGGTDQQSARIPSEGRTVGRPRKGPGIVATGEAIRLRRSAKPVVPETSACPAPAGAEETSIANRRPSMSTRGRLPGRPAFVVFVGGGSSTSTRRPLRANLPRLFARAEQRFGSGERYFNPTLRHMPAEPLCAPSPHGPPIDLPFNDTVSVRLVPTVTRN